MIMHRAELPRAVRRHWATAVACLITAAIALPASIALAQTYTGNNSDEAFIGTSNYDDLYAGGGSDMAWMGASGDYLGMGWGKDSADGEGGPDVIKGRDGDDKLYSPYLGGNKGLTGSGGGDRIEGDDNNVGADFLRG